MSLLEKQYPRELDLLRELFRSRSRKGETIDERRPRLNEIYEVTEECWERNLDRLKGRPVKYLLIGEAAPWSPASEEITYFYRTFNGNSKLNKGRPLKPVSWITSVWNVFTNDAQQPNSLNEVFDILAEKGFLIVDSLPFAENYSKRRPSVTPNHVPATINNNRYFELVRSCIPYLQNKLSSIVVSSDTRIAFLLGGHARLLMHALGYQLNINTLKFGLLEDQISNKKPGSLSLIRGPHPSKLREIWNIK